MGRLLRIKGRKTWFFRAKVNGVPVTWSTGETDKRKALAKMPELEARARFNREEFDSSSAGNSEITFTHAMEQEVCRVKSDISELQSIRVDFALTNFLRWLKRDISIKEVTTALLEDYQRMRLSQVSRGTVDKELNYVTRTLKNHGHLVARPGAKPGSKTKQRAFTLDELKSFFKACDAIPKEEPGRYTTLFLTMLVTGARPAELLPSKRSGHTALLKSEVDFKHRLVTIRPSKRRRGQDGQPRVVEIDSELAERLKTQIASTPKEWPHVFTLRTNLCHLFDTIIKKAQITKTDILGRKVTAHCFRHTFATRANDQVGGNLAKLMAALGHTQVSTTMGYTHAKVSQDLSLKISEVIETEVPDDPGIFMGEGI